MAGKKNYIGSGKQHPNYDIIRVSICIDDAMKFFNEYQGKQYLTFDVARKREVDQYGKTHSVSVWTPDDGSVPPEQEPPADNRYDNRSGSTYGFDDSDIPF